MEVKVEVKVEVKMEVKVEVKVGVKHFVLDNTTRAQNYRPWAELINFHERKRVNFIYNSPFLLLVNNQVNSL